MQDIIERKYLDLQKYDPLINYLQRVEVRQIRSIRQYIIESIKAELKKLDKKDLKIKYILAQNIVEYQTFLALLDKKEKLQSECRKPEKIEAMLKKTAKRQNFEMFTYLFNKYPEFLFPIDSDLLFSILKFDNQELLLSILQYARINNKKIKLKPTLYPFSSACSACNIDLLITFFEQIKKCNFFIVATDTFIEPNISSILHEITINEENVRNKLDQLLETLPENLVLMILLSQDSCERNICHRVLNHLSSAYTPELKENIIEIINTIKNFCIRKNLAHVWNELILAKDKWDKTPSENVCPSYRPQIKGLFERLPPP